MSEIVYKKCCKCEIEKELFEFSKDANNKDLHRNECKVCNKKYRISNKEHISKKGKEYYQDNRAEIKKKAVKYREDNKEYMKTYSKKYYQDNTEMLSNKGKIYYIDNKETVDTKHRKYYHENKEKIREQKREYWLNNKERLCEKKNIYREENKERINHRTRADRKNNPEKYKKYWLIYKQNSPHIISWRSILINALKSMNLDKTQHTIDMLGYSAEDLKVHIESLFVDGMSWENRSEWHIDHKIPLSAFKKDTPMSIVNSLENLQPLWAFDNISKHDKILEEYKNMDIYIKYCEKK